MTENTTNQYWTIRIQPHVRRNIVVQYKQTILSPLWYLIQPILTIIMNMVVFRGIAKMSTDGMPQTLFYMAGNICWFYFSEYLGAGTSIKFIEAVMMNRPIIFTQMGARGFNSAFQANKHYLLANNDQEFADQAVSVLYSFDKANAMTHNAYEIGKSHFSKSSFFDVAKKSVDTISKHQT